MKFAHYICFLSMVINTIYTSTYAITPDHIVTHVAVHKQKLEQSVQRKIISTLYFLEELSEEQAETCVRELFEFLNKQENRQELVLFLEQTIHEKVLFYQERLEKKYDKRALMLGVFMGILAWYIGKTSHNAFRNQKELQKTIAKTDQQLGNLKITCLAVDRERQALSEKLSFCKSAFLVSDQPQEVMQYVASISEKDLACFEQQLLVLTDECSKYKSKFLGTEVLLNELIKQKKIGRVFLGFGFIT